MEVELLKEISLKLNKLEGIERRLVGIESEVSSMKTGLTSVKDSQVRMETEFGRKLDVLYHDWRESQKQFNDAILTEVRNLATKVEELQIVSNTHDVALRGVK